MTKCKESKYRLDRIIPDEKICKCGHHEFDHMYPGTKGACIVCGVLGCRKFDVKNKNIVDKF